MVYLFEVVSPALLLCEGELRHDWFWCLPGQTSRFEIRCPALRFYEPFADDVGNGGLMRCFEKAGIEFYVVCRFLGQS